MDPLGNDFRKAMRRLTSAVSVISTAHDGIRHGITVTSVTSVSMTPPSILFCVNRASRLHNPLVCAGHFCVNILHAHQIEIATVGIVGRKVGPRTAVQNVVAVAAHEVVCAVATE